eukprot:gene12303-biopygen4785
MAVVGCKSKGHPSLKEARPGVAGVAASEGLRDSHWLDEGVAELALGLPPPGSEVSWLPIAVAGDMSQEHCRYKM